MRKRLPVKRRGAAFVLLVTALLLVVLAASHSLIKSEVASRAHQRDQATAKMLLRAIETAQQTDITTQESLRFPIDDLSSVVVTKSQDNTELVATLYTAKQAVQSVQRPIATREKQTQ